MAGDTNKSDVEQYLTKNGKDLQYPECTECRERILGTIVTEKDFKDLECIWNRLKNGYVGDEFNEKAVCDKLKELIEKIKKEKNEENVNKFINKLMNIITPNIDGEYYWEEILDNLQEQNDEVSKKIGISIISNIPEKFDCNEIDYRVMKMFFYDYIKNYGSLNENECYHVFYKKMQECLKNFEEKLMK